MKKVIKIYRLFNILSLDVAAGAVISALLFAKIFGTTPTATSLISLGLTVWIIYTADRLLDVRDIRGEITSERHRFHKRHYVTFKRWLLFIGMINLALLFFMPTMIIKLGLVLSIVVTIYILFRRHLYLFKEFLVALLYTAGVVLPVLPIQISFNEFLLLIPFFFIALLNLIIFSQYERENDLKDNQESIATILNERSIQYLLSLLFIITFSISGFFFLTKIYFVSLMFVGMTAILFVIFRHRRFFEKNDYYRLVGDAVFLLPLVYIFK